MEREGWGAGRLLSLVLGLGLAVIVVPDLGAQDFVRGDVNFDTKVDLADAGNLFLYLIGDGPFGGQLPCLDAADGNDDGSVDVADCMLILNYLFLGGTAPPPPGPALSGCGPDPTPDPLDCEFPLCVP